VNICIWFQFWDGPWGGGQQFLRALKAELAHRGHQVTQKPTRDSEIVLVNAHQAGRGRHLHPGQVAELLCRGRATRLGRYLPAWSWLMGGRRRAAVVHRLDGIAEVIRGRRTPADRLQPAINRLAQHTIFQSRYSEVAFAARGVTPAGRTVIHNGVDGEVFYPDRTRSGSPDVLRMAAISWSPNLSKGFDVLARLSEMPGVQVRFIGRWCPEVDPARVVLLGTHPSARVAELLRECDVVVHAGLHESCSNALLEGLACGLPALYRDSGGTREVAGECGVALTDDLRASVDELRVRYATLRERTLEDRERFLIGRATDRYLEVFMDLIASRTRG
jgi:glycosyltransferase involved in cell wall biosynthesis